MNRTFGQALRYYFLTGLAVVVPVGLTLFAIGWLVRAVDGLLGGVIESVSGVHMPGFGLACTAFLIIAVGMLMSSLLVKHLFAVFEEWLLRVPGVRAVYKTVKVLTDMFSPENKSAFRQVALVEYPAPGTFTLAFVTSHTTLAWRAGEPERYVSVYIPTNHFYLGNTMLLPESKVWVTGLSVEQGIELVLTSGAAFPEQRFAARTGA